MQKRRICGKIFAAWILAALMLISVGWSSGVVRAEGHTESIGVKLPEDSGNAELSLYAVATYRNGVFTLTEDFADSKVEITDLNSAQKIQTVAKELVDFIQARGLSGQPARPDSSGLVKYTGLAPALYMVMQTAGFMDIRVQTALVSVPYQGSEGTTVHDAMIFPKYEYPGGDTLVTKLDDAGVALAGAEFILQQKVYLRDGISLPEGAVQENDEKGSYFWKEYVTNLVSDENGQIVIQDMPKGQYRLVEVKSPEGFLKNVEPIYFSVDTYGKVTKQNGKYVPGEGQVTQVSVTNTPTSLKVEKVDPEGKQLPGAKLMVKKADGGMILDGDGNPLYVFTSGEEPEVLKRLPAGEYLVTELEAPEGFRISPDVKVTVSDEADAENHVTIVDEEEVPTGRSVTVQKALVDLNGMPVFGRDGVFYVALFSDPEHTQRVSSVQPVHFKGESTDSVTFENLENDLTYYVGETDEFGNYIESDLEEVGGNSFYNPIYPGDTSVTVDEETGEATYYFENVFVRIPDDFYYNADVIVTKKVLKGQEAYNTDEVYYCALFRDEACTDRMGDVAALAMNGGSEASVTIPVDIGGSMDKVFTYYIRETDQDGVPLENTKELGFTVTQDKDQVTLSYQDNKAEVVITNTYEEDPTPTPDPSESPTPGVTGTPAATVTPGTTPGGSTPPTTHSGPRTGDDTNIALYVILLLIAVAAGVIVYIRKRKKE